MLGGSDNRVRKNGFARLRARLHAWWEGYDYQAELDGADLSEPEPPKHNIGYIASEAPPEAPAYKPPPKIVALDLMWGGGRMRPGDDETDQQAVTRLDLPVNGLLAIIGPGLAAPVVAVANRHSGKIDVYEWRDDMFAPLQQGVREADLEGRVTVKPFDLKTPELPRRHYDGLISIDDHAFGDAAPNLVQVMMDCLKPGARLVVDSYVSAGGEHGEDGLRSPNQLSAHLKQAGFSIEGREDLTKTCLKGVREGFKRLSEKLTSNAGLEVAEVQEVANEAGAWRKKLTQLAQNKLQRLRLVGRKAREERAPPPKKQEAAPASDRNEVAWRVKPDNSLEVLQKVLGEEERKTQRAKAQLKP